MEKDIYKGHIHILHVYSLLSYSLYVPLHTYTYINMHAFMQVQLEEHRCWLKRSSHENARIYLLSITN